MSGPGTGPLGFSSPAQGGHTHHSPCSVLRSTPSAGGRPCGDSCPEYQLVSRTARYEVRLYPAAVWVSYVTATENRLLAEMEAQAGIDDYLGGANDRGKE